MSTESFYSELKRRKVFRVGTGYVVTGWILLQLGDVVIEPLGLPDWVQTNLIYVIAGMFPIVLILAWIYELTGHGLVRDPGPDLGGEEGVAGLGATGFEVSKLASPALPSGGRSRLAVLPFVDLGPGGEERYLAEGLAIEILAAASRHPDLEVVARTSSFRFEGRDADLVEVRDRLGASHALVGTVQSSRDRMRFSIQLIDLSSHVQIWAETYQRDSIDAYDAQEQVAQSAVRALFRAMDLEGEAPKRSWVTSPESYEQYLLAANAYRRSRFAKAIEYAEKAIELDARNPLAPVLLAETYLTWTRYGFSMGRDEFLLARKNVAHAQEIDPDSSPARSVGGMITLYLDRRFDVAFEQVAQAAMEEPGLVEWLPVLLSYADRYHESVELQKRIVRRDPLNPLNLLTLANRMTWIGREDDAARLCARAHDLDPNHLIFGQVAFRAAIRDGDLGRAEQLLRHWGYDLKGTDRGAPDAWPPFDVGLWLRARLEMARGDADEAYRLAQAIEKGSGVTPTLIAETYISAGAIDDAYRVCDLGIRSFDVGIYDVARPHETRLPGDPEWLAFAADDRYPGLLERLGVDEASLKKVDWSIVDRVMQGSQL